MPRPSRACRAPPPVGREGACAYDESDTFDATEDWENVTPEILFDANEGLVIMGPETAHFVQPHLVRVICTHRRRNEAADNFPMHVEGWLTGTPRRVPVSRLDMAQRAALLDVLAAMDRAFYHPSGPILPLRRRRRFRRFPTPEDGTVPFRVRFARAK